MAIAQTIHGEGLEVFYARRSQSGDKPAAYLASNETPEKLKPYDDPSLRGRFTRPSGDGDSLETTLRLEKIRCAACVWCRQYSFKTRCDQNDMPGLRRQPIHHEPPRCQV